MLSGRYPSDDFAELRAAHHVGPNAGTGQRARGCAAPRGHERRHHPRSRPLRRLPARFWRRGRRKGLAARRRARRGDGLRASRGRGLPPRRVVVEGGRDHARSRHRHARGRRAGQDAVLARRPPRAPARVRRGASARSRAASRAPATTRRRERLRDELTARRRAPRGTSSRTCASSRARRARCRATGPSCVERFRDELGDWRVCVLSPFGARVHAPWATVVLARLRSATPATRRPSGPTTASSSASRPATSRPIRPRSSRLRTRSRRSSSESLGSTSLFAARFRESGGARAPPAAALTRQAHAALGPAQARRRSPRRRLAVSVVSRSCSRRTASACATCSTFLPWRSSSSVSRRGRSA